jgi:hypothetical protein
LRAGKEHPTVLGKRLVPLLTALPILNGTLTRKPAGDLISVLHPMLPMPDRRDIESAILKSDNHAKEILLGCLSEKDIVSETARELRKAILESGPLPENREPIEFSHAWKGDDNWWLREQGVDLSKEDNKAILGAIKAVEAIKPPEGVVQDREVLVSKWKQVVGLYETITSHSNIPDALRMSGLDAVADLADKAASVCDTISALDQFPRIEQMIRSFVTADLTPLPIADPENEEAFARSPSWGRPAPRLVGAGALMMLYRAKGTAEPDLANIVEGLARDPSPAVRHQILARTNVLFSADPALMWRLCDIGFKEEANKGVLTFFLAAVGRLLRSRPEWIAKQLLHLDNRLASSHKREDRHEFLAHLVSLLLNLWFVHDQESAGERIRQWINEPIAHIAYVLEAVSALRSALVEGDPLRPDPLTDRIRARAIEIVETSVSIVGPLFVHLSTKPEPTETDRTNAEACFRILDQVALEIYFGSGAYAQANRPQIATDTTDTLVTTPEVRRRFLKEMVPTLRGLAAVPYPSVTHRLLETLEVFVPDNPPLVFRLVTDALLKGGELGGYPFESLGSDLFVRIVRLYLVLCCINGFTTIDLFHDRLN